MGYKCRLDPDPIYQNCCFVLDYIVKFHILKFGTHLSSYAELVWPRGWDQICKVNAPGSRVMWDQGYLRFFVFCTSDGEVVMATSIGRHILIGGEMRVQENCKCTMINLYCGSQPVWSRNTVRSWG